EDLLLWHMVPSCFDGICAWAELEVEQRQNGSMRHVLIYSPTLLYDLKKHVTIRLQGFLGKTNITTFGNWNGKEGGAVHAVQYLTLTSQGCNDAFTAQVKALEGIHKFVARSLNREMDSLDVEPDSICLQRRVFTKVDNEGEFHAASDYRNQDSRVGAAQKMQRCWVVSHTIKTGLRLENGSVTHTSHIVFRPGDFVDVSMFADVIELHRRKERRLEVQFAMEHVVRLMSVVDVKVRF
ncbi:hypothetical protein BKA93DRAFT_693789, partial [Sparassis latifolia]